MNTNLSQHHHDSTLIAGAALTLAVASLLAAPLAHSQSATPAANPSVAMAAAAPVAAPRADATVNELMRFSDSGSRAIQDGQDEGCILILPGDLGRVRTGTAYL